MKLALIADAHANLPALDAALDAVAAEGYDLLVHLGDLIAIGPFPAECIERLMTTPRTRSILGNHDAYYAFGLPQPRPSWMSAGELDHQRWTHGMIGPSLREEVASWHLPLRLDCGARSAALMHYARDDDSGDFVAEMVREPEAHALDALFARYDPDMICFGHTHTSINVQGRRHYFNPGSLGCQPRPLAPDALLTCTKAGWQIDERVACYDDGNLRRVFACRQVPERRFLDKAFFGGRLGHAARSTSPGEEMLS